MEYKFTGYLVQKNQIPFPDIIILTANNIIYKKWYILGYTSTIIRKNMITSFSISKGVFFADILITGHNTNIIAKGFINKDALKIKSILNF